MLVAAAFPRWCRALRERASVVVPALVLLVASPVHAWLFTLPGSPATAARGLAIAPDKSIVAAGDLGIGRGVFTVVRIDPETGNELTAYFHDLSNDGQANAVVG